MDIMRLRTGGFEVPNTLKLLLFLLSCSLVCLEQTGRAQPRESLAGEKAAQTLKEAAEAEAKEYQLRYGPVYFRPGAGVRLGYTDNLFYSENNRRDDFLINPEATLAAFMRVSDINTLRFSLGLGYEYYLDNTDLNGDAPLVNPDSELVFNLFVSDFRIKLREKFSYQETLFYNSGASRQDLGWNFSDVGRFSRWDNLIGFTVDWDLNKVILSAGYDHENFSSTSARFDYLDRVSEWFTASAAYRLGDHATTGLEGRASWHDFDTELVLNDHWRARIGPFVDVQPLEKINFRLGGGYETADFDADAVNSDFDDYYAYSTVSQEMRLFRHSISAGHEHVLGDNANNLKTTFVRYSISSPVVRYVELGAYGAVHFAEEFGGGFEEDFTYGVVGARAEYQIHKYWRTGLGYEFSTRDSRAERRDYYRNRVTLGVAFTY